MLLDCFPELQVKRRGSSELGSDTQYIGCLASSPHIWRVWPTGNNLLHSFSATPLTDNCLSSGIWKFDSAYPALHLSCQLTQSMSCCQIPGFIGVPWGVNKYSDPTTNSSAEGRLCVLLKIAGLEPSETGTCLTSAVCPSYPQLQLLINISSWPGDIYS